MKSLILLLLFGVFLAGCGQLSGVGKQLTLANETPINTTNISLPPAAPAPTWIVYYCATNSSNTTAVRPTIEIIGGVNTSSGIDLAAMQNVCVLYNSTSLTVGVRV